jgi:hypothetical protein
MGEKRRRRVEFKYSINHVALISSQVSEVINMSVSAVGSSAASAQLIKLANGEYSAASVAADPKDATLLRLVKQSDGNYGVSPPTSASAKSSSGVLAGLGGMRLGGA